MTQEQRERLLAITDYDEYDRQRDTFGFPTFGSGEVVDVEVVNHLVWLSNQKFPGEAHIDPNEGDLFEPQIRKT